MNSLTDFIVGCFLILVWLRYEGSLIIDLAAYIQRIIK
jgi:drug/metabolite transporter superfamily protein YnfA